MSYATNGGGDGTLGGGSGNQLKTSNSTPGLASMAATASGGGVVGGPGAGIMSRSSVAGSATQHLPGRPQSYAFYGSNTSKDSDCRLLWEMRVANRTPNVTPASTVLNSPDLTDLDAKLRYQHGTLMQHHQIKVGRSPVGSNGGNNDSSNNSTNPSSPTQQY